MVQLAPLLRLCSEHGVCRGPTVGLTVVASLLLKCETAISVDLFPMSLQKGMMWEEGSNLVWQPEAQRLQSFLLSGRLVCVGVA